MSKIEKIILLIYIILGVILSNVDTLALILYVTVLPLHYILMRYAYSTGRILLFVLFLIAFLTFGINPVFYFLNRENATTIGFGAVGNYDFSISRYFYVYSYLFVWFISILIFDKFFGSRINHPHFKNYIIEICQNLKDYYSSGKNYTIVISCICIITALLSNWMYENNIGVIGLKQTQLPFHLTGILFYSRRVLVPILIVYLFFKSSNKGPISLLLIPYAIFMGITSSSKSVVLITLLPVFLLLLYEKKNKFALITFLGFAYGYVVTSVSRTFSIADATVTMATGELLSNTEMLMSKYEGNFLIDFIGSISARLGGANSIILYEQYQNIGFKQLIDYYLGAHPESIIPDFCYSIYGFHLPEDKAWGVAFYFPGAVVMLAKHSYLLILLQSIWMFLLMYICEQFIGKIFYIKGHYILKTIILFLCVYQILRVWTGEVDARFQFYLLVIALFFVNKFYSNRFQV